MLKITILGGELYDDKKEEFIQLKSYKISLEHSLVSVSKWESKWKKPFLTKTPKTKNEFKDYVKCMTITQNVDPIAYEMLSVKNYAEIDRYINDPMSATTIEKDDSGPKNREVVTAEIIYYWMVTMNIPVEFQKWHLNRLLTLIDVVNIKNSPGKKKVTSKVLEERRSLMKKRRKESKG